MTTRTYTVEGMTCSHCVTAITTEVSKLPQVTEVSVDLAGKSVTVVGEQLDDAAISEAVDEAGYTVVA